MCSCLEIQYFHDPMYVGSIVCYLHVKDRNTKDNRTTGNTEAYKCHCSQTTYVLVPNHSQHLSSSINASLFWGVRVHKFVFPAFFDDLNVKNVKDLLHF
jgi:hypothetical protein